MTETQQTVATWAQALPRARKESLVGLVQHETAGLVAATLSGRRPKGKRIDVAAALARVQVALWRAATAYKVELAHEVALLMAKQRMVSGAQMDTESAAAEAVGSEVTLSLPAANGGSVTLTLKGEPHGEAHG